jgi:imidazolonepropionase-like amidohydrolase
MKERGILVKNISLIDSVQEEATDNMSILIKEDKIQKIGRNIDPGEEVQVIEGEGRTAMPGLIDCHIHIVLDGAPDHSIRGLRDTLSMMTIKAVNHISRYLPAGFTTICDEGSPEYLGVSLRNAIEAGIIEGPRVIASGKMLSITGGHGQFFPPWVSVEETMAEIVDGPDRLREAVRRQLAAGVDVVKFCSTGGILDPVSEPQNQEYSNEEMAAIIGEADRVGKRTSTHAQGPAGIKAAVRAGVHSIEHGSLMDDECLALMKEKGTFLVPTLVPGYLIIEHGIEGGIPAVSVNKANVSYNTHIQSFKKAIQAGIKISMGTDSGTPFNHHGSNAVELELMVRYGMSEIAAIMASTRVAAENLMIADKVGTIEEGKLADIIILDGNPLSDIRLLQDKDRIKLVIKAGSIKVMRSNR